MSGDCAKELTVQIRSGWRVIALETFEEERALRLLDRVAKGTDRKLVIWSVATGVSGNGAGAGSLDAGLRELATRSDPALFVLLDPGRHMESAEAVRRLRDFLPALAKKRQVVVLLGPVVDLPLELMREAGRVELPLPRAAELAPIFRKIVAGQGAELDEDSLAGAVSAALGLTAAEAARVFRKACSLAGGPGPAVVDEIVREKRGVLRRTPSLSFHDTDSDLADVGGLGELKRWLGERQRSFSAEARSFGVPVPRGLLLLGVQGCGKSLSAKAVARQWRFPLLRLDLAATFGATERSPEATIREAMAIGESLAPAVLWIDEIEKGFAASNADPRSARVFGAFLTWLAEKKQPVFVVATANDVTELPPELLRRGRFDELFFVDLPTVAERVEILAIHLRKQGRDPKQFDLQMLAEEAELLSGAELEQVVASGLHEAFAHDRDLTESDLANAISETVPLYETYEERIKELRDWARTRTRPATLDARMADLFSSR